MKMSEGCESRNWLQRACDWFNDMSTGEKVTVLTTIVSGICVVIHEITDNNYRLDTKWFSLRPDRPED